MTCKGQGSGRAESFEIGRLPAPQTVQANAVAGGCFLVVRLANIPHSLDAVRQVNCDIVSAKLQAQQNQGGQPDTPAEKRPADATCARAPAANSPPVPRGIQSLGKESLKQLDDHGFTDDDAAGLASPATISDRVTL